MIRFSVLGSIDLRRPDGSEVRSVLVQPKRTAFLAFLALSPGVFRRRDELRAVFWPEHNDDRARGNLNTAISFLRRELGSQIFLTRGDEEIAADPTHLWCDAAAFEEALRADRLIDASHLYAGELLQGLHLTDVEEFERWLDSERARLRAMARKCAVSLAERSARAADHIGAVHWARRALELDPFDEAALRRMLEYLNAGGDRAGAIAAYESFAAALRRELAVTPSGQTQRLVEEIRSEPRDGRAPPTPPTAPHQSSPDPVRDERSVSAGAAAGIHRPARRGRYAVIAAGTLAGVSLVTSGYYLSRVKIQETAPPVIAPQLAQTLTGTKSTAAAAALRESMLIHDRPDSRREDRERALQLASKAIALDSTFAPAYMALGIWLAELNRQRGDPEFPAERTSMDSALTLMSRSMVLNPNSAVTHGGYAILLQNEGRLQEALDQRRLAAHLAPHLLYNVGWTALLLGRPDEALPALANGRRAVPGRPCDTNGLIGWSYLALEDYRLATDWAHEATVPPDSVTGPAECIWALEVSGVAAIASGRHNEARAVVSRLNHEYWNPYVVRSIASALALLADDSAEARSLAEAALRITPPLSKGYWFTKEMFRPRTTLAYLLWQSGKRDSALKLLRHQEAIDSARIAAGDEWSMPRYDLAVVHAIRGENGPALEKLHDAGRHGFLLARLAELDPRLGTLREQPAFRQFIAAVRQRVAELRKVSIVIHSD